MPSIRLVLIHILCLQMTLIKSLPGFNDIQACVKDASNNVELIANCMDSLKQNENDIYRSMSEYFMKRSSYQVMHEESLKDLKTMIRDEILSIKSMFHENNKETALMKKVILEKNKEIESLKIVIQNKTNELESKETMIQERNNEIESLKIVIQNKTKELESKETTIQERNNEIQSLRTAIQEKDKEIESLKIVIQNKSKDPICEKYKASPNTPLHDAVQNGKSKLVEKLLRECGELVNIPDANGYTPLQLAVNKQDWAVMKILLKFNSTIVGLVFERKLMEDALKKAAVSGELKKFEIILQIFPDWMNVKYDNWGATVLHVASRDGHLNIVEKILQKHPQMIQQKTNTGQSPLHVAALNGHLNIVECLLMNGADSLQRDNENMTPRDVTIQYKFGDWNRVAKKLEESERKRK